MRLSTGEAKRSRWAKAKPSTAGTAGAGLRPRRPRRGRPTACAARRSVSPAGKPAGPCSRPAAAYLLFALTLEQSSLEYKDRIRSSAAAVSCLCILTAPSQINRKRLRASPSAARAATFCYLAGRSICPAALPSRPAQARASSGHFVTSGRRRVLRRLPTRFAGCESDR